MSSSAERPFAVCVQSLSLVQLFVAPWTAAHHVSWSFTISQSLLKFMTIEPALVRTLYLVLQVIRSLQGVVSMG